MKNDKQNQIQVKESGKSNVRPSFLSKPTQRYYINAGTAIFAVIILHLIAQFIFFKSETPQHEITSAKTANEQNVEIKTEYEVEKPDVVTQTAPVLPGVEPQPKKAAPSRTLIKKKEQPPRESRAERLRRAERILTGV